jgi:hypothetical protein
MRQGVIEVLVGVVCASRQSIRRTGPKRHIRKGGYADLGMISMHGVEVSSRSGD